MLCKQLGSSKTGPSFHLQFFLFTPTPWYPKQATLRRGWSDNAAEKVPVASAYSCSAAARPSWRSTLQRWAAAGRTGGWSGASPGRAHTWRTGASSLCEGKGKTVSESKVCRQTQTGRPRQPQKRSESQCSFRCQRGADVWFTDKVDASAPDRWAALDQLHGAIYLHAPCKNVSGPWEHPKGREVAGMCVGGRPTGYRSLSARHHALAVWRGRAGHYEHRLATQSSFHRDPHRGLGICLLTFCRSMFKRGNETKFVKVRTGVESLVKGEREMGGGHMFPSFKQPTNPLPPLNPNVSIKTHIRLRRKSFLPLSVRSKASLKFSRCISSQ